MPQATDTPRRRPPPRTKSAAGPQSTAPYHHGDLPAALLSAAQIILAEEGLDALSLRATARAVGVSHAAPKNHFGDLAGLLSELAAVGFRDFAATLRAAAAAHDGPPDTRFDAIGRGYVGFAREHTAMFLLMFRSERLDATRPALRDALAQARDALADVAAERLGIEPAMAVDASISARQRASMVRAWSLVHGFAMLMIDGRLDPLLAQRPEGPDWRSLLDAVFADR